MKTLCRRSTLQSPSRRIKMFKRLADVWHDSTVAPDSERIRGIVGLPRSQEKPLGSTMICMLHFTNRYNLTA